MTLILREALLSDIEALVDIYFSAFTIDAISLLAFPRNNTAVTKFWLDMLTEEFSDPFSRFVVVTSAEQVVAWAHWVLPKNTEISTEMPQWPEGCDVQLANHFFTNLFQRRKKSMGERPHWYLELVATRPEWQGKGAAGKLLRWGLEKADDEKLEAYLEASPDGKPIYEHFGFVETERMVVDLEGRDPCGTGETAFVEVMMIRAAKRN